MAEQTLSELVMNLISWIESLHEKNLKYEAQVESLSRDLTLVKSSNEELEARLKAYQGVGIGNNMTTDPLQTTSLTTTTLVSDPNNTLQPIQQQQQHHLHHHQLQHSHHQQQQQQHQQPQLVYQTLPPTTSAHQPLLPPPPPSTATTTNPYLWYDTSTSNGLGAGGQVSYYEHYAGTAPAFAQQQQ